MASKLGHQIDVMYEADRAIKKVETELRELKQHRAKLETRLLRSFDKEDIHGCTGRRGKAFIQSTDFPRVEDRVKLDRYVLKKRALDLFTSRVSVQAWKDRIDDGEKVPGVGVFTRIRVSIRKR